LAGSDVFIVMGAGAGVGACQKNHATIAKSIVAESCDNIFIVIESDTAKPYNCLVVMKINADFSFADINKNKFVYEGDADEKSSVIYTQSLVVLFVFIYMAGRQSSRCL